VHHSLDDGPPDPTTSQRTVTTVARARRILSLATDPGQVRNRRAIAISPKRSPTPSFVKLAIWLSLDPSVTWLEYVDSLHFAECTVMVKMLVADNDEGRVAFDIVDERPVRDIDAEGLLLLALEHHQIQIVETDSASINREPRVSNSLRIWRHRGRQVEKGLVAKIDGALAGQRSVSIRSLGTLVGLSEPLAIASALICRRLLDTDLSIKFGLNSLVTRRWDFGATLISKNYSAVRFCAGKKP
jgi:hypothetical protein